VTFSANKECDCTEKNRDSIPSAFIARFFIRIEFISPGLQMFNLTSVGCCGLRCRARTYILADSRY
jgi:hypothetical protein